MRKQYELRLLFLFFFVAISQSAVAREWVTKVDNSFLGESHVKNMTGHVQMNESSLRLQYDTKFREQLPVSLSLNFKHLNIDESLPVQLPAHLEGRSLGLGVKFPMPFVERDDLFMGFDIYPSLYTDDWDWEGGAFRLPFRTYFIYKPDDNFIFVAGAWIRVDYDSPIVPIIGLIYKPNDRLSFNLASEDPHIAYRINEQWTIFTEFRFLIDEYEVTRGQNQHVVLKYSESRAGIGCRFQPNHNFEIAFSAGGVGGRRLDYEDDNGKVVPKATEYVRLKVGLKF